jgi:hypothetical protein
MQHMVHKGEIRNFVIMRPLTFEMAITLVLLGLESK